MIGAKRAQAALEFLTTYGWAFLVILVMIGALAYFGVLDPDRFLPDKCRFSSGVECVDSYAQSNEHYMKLQLINNFGTPINIPAQSSLGHQVIVEDRLCPSYQNKEISINGTIIYDAGGGPETSTMWLPNQVLEMRIGDVDGNQCELQLGTRPVVSVSIAYLEAGSTYTKTIEGEVSLKVNE